MSSTNVHSNQNIHIVGGQTIPPEKLSDGLEIPPKGAGKGPTKKDVREGEQVIISVQNHYAGKEGKNILGRVSENGQILSGKENIAKEIIAEIEKKTIKLGQIQGKGMEK